MYALAIFYWNGQGVAPNRAAAMFLLRQAYERGSQEAGEFLSDIERRATDQKLRGMASGLLDAITVPADQMDQQQHMAEESRQLQSIRHGNGPFQ